VSANGYLQRLVARHSAPLAVRPRTLPTFAAEPIERGGESVPSPRATRVRPLSEPEPGAVLPRTPQTTPISEPVTLTMVQPEGPSRAPADRAAGVSVGEVSRSTDAVPLLTDRDDDVGVLRERPVSTEVSEAHPAVTVARGLERNVESPQPNPAPARVAEPRVAAARRRARVDETVVSTAQGADTIHVHIGRVEVRAITPPADRQSNPSPRPAGPQPLSLDDYLAKRAPR
jgi:hypothetical protein